MLETIKFTAKVRKIVLFYPSGALLRQTTACARRCEACQVQPAYVRSAFEVRRALQRADLVVVDATEDYVQAMDVFAQAVTRLGWDRVTVYSEQMHEGLELFVRSQGSWLLFGPLSDVQWEDFFHRALWRRRATGERAA